MNLIFFLFIRVENVWARMLFRILLIPIVAGISYEFIRLAGNSDSPVVALLSKPGMWLQGLTTREPDDSMIEVAIASVEAVFDWRAYQQKEKVTTAARQKKQLTKIPTVVTEPEKESDKASVGVSKKAKKTKNAKKAGKPVEHVQKPEEVTAEAEFAVTDSMKAVKSAANKEAAKNARRERERQMASIESAVVRIGLPDEDDDDDEILKALDRFFGEKEEGKDTP